MKKRFFLPIVGYFIGWFYWKTLLEPWPMLLFVAAFLGWGAAIGLKKQPKGKMHRFWAGVTVLIALALSLKRCNATQDWGILALHGTAVLWALSYLGADRGGEDVLGFAWDCLDGFLLLPFGNFFGRVTDTLCALGALFKPFKGEENQKKRRDFWLAALCLLLALPLLILVTDLLGQADSGFESLVQGFQNIFRLELSQNFWDEFFWFILGLPVGAYLYGLVRGAARRENTPVLSAAQLEKLHVLPGSGANLVLGLFCGVYFLFFGVQAGNLFAVFSGHIPGTLTASDYARSGFFQLCTVMAINFFLIWLLSLLTKASPLGRGLQAVLMVQSIFLAVTAGAKLWLYIARFGFTPLRLLSAWAVLVLAAGCLLMLYTLGSGKKTFRLWLYFAAGTFTALCFY